MKYLFQNYPGSSIEAVERLSPDEQQRIREEYLAIAQLPGVLGGAALQPAETATTVRVQNGETLLTDGPFIDAKEHIGGYLVIEADDLDAALQIAARVPAARMGGTVDVRPLKEIAALLDEIFRDEWGRVLPTRSGSSATRPRRGGRPRGVRRRSPALASHGRAAQPGRVADGHGPQPRPRPPSPGADAHREGPPARRADCRGGRDARDDVH
jgi:hypothetical protein